MIDQELIKYCIGQKIDFPFNSYIEVVRYTEKSYLVKFIRYSKFYYELLKEIGGTYISSKSNASQKGFIFPLWKESQIRYVYIFGKYDKKLERNFTKNYESSVQFLKEPLRVGLRRFAKNFDFEKTYSKKYVFSNLPFTLPKNIKEKIRKLFSKEKTVSGACILYILFSKKGEVVLETFSGPGKFDVSYYYFGPREELKKIESKHRIKRYVRIGCNGKAIYYKKSTFTGD